MIRNLHRILRISIRWASISALISALLFVAAGSTRLISLRLYLIAFSAMLLATMFAVDPQLAYERAHPGQEAGRAQLRFAAGFFFLLTLTIASFCVGHLHSGPAVPSWLLSTALLIFVASGSLQMWAMVTNPFFSPVVRLQNERGHRLIDSGPYRFIRHPGYFAMCISIPASALAIGSWSALIPAVVFVLIIQKRARLEDEFLKAHLSGYAEYAHHVPAGLPFSWSF